MPIADPGAKTSGQVFRKPPTTFRRAVILLAALLAMLNSCAGGVSVVNIDNGFGAGYIASMINKLK